MLQQHVDVYHVLVPFASVLDASVQHVDALVLIDPPAPDAPALMSVLAFAREEDNFAAAGVGKAAGAFSRRDRVVARLVKRSARALVFYGKLSSNGVVAGKQQWSGRCRRTMLALFRLWCVVLSSPTCVSAPCSLLPAPASLALGTFLLFAVPVPVPVPASAVCVCWV